MQLKTGVDMVDISRIRRSCANPRFLAEFYSDKEREQLALRGNNIFSVAGSFAAKEAFAKAVGTGISGFALRDISVLRDKKGHPYYELSGKAAKLYSSVTFSVSISHTNTHAVAFAVAIFDENSLQEML